MTNNTRRSFLKSASLAAAAPIFARSFKVDRLPIAFSTLGAPAWDWKTILKNAAEWQFSAIEMRGLKDQIDLYKSPQFMGENIKTSKLDLKALGLKISDLGSSANLHERDAKKRQEQLDGGRRYIDLAHQLEVPLVRVFPNSLMADEARRITVERIIDGLVELGRYARGSGVTVIVESHGDFTDSPTLLQILQGAQMSTTGFLWDAHHTCVMGHEKPEDTLKILGKYVRHTHLKDSVPAGKDRKYVLTGTGNVPVRETVKALKVAGYKGYFCFEWEKRWHPEIEEPEVSLPHFAKVMKEYLSSADAPPVGAARP
jgi:sugar phosphate isomerase/epimerase